MKSSFASSSRSGLFLVVLSLCAAACADAQQPQDGSNAGNGGATNQEDTASSEAAISGSACVGVSAKDYSHYPLQGPNVGRELEESLSATFVQTNTAKLPGVLRARHSTSPYDFAATLDLRGWSIASTGNFDGNGSELFVRMSGASNDPDKRNFKASKALYDAMTRATQTTGNGATRRSSSHGSVVCERYSNGGSYQCALGPLHTVTPLEGACP